MVAVARLRVLEGRAPVNGVVICKALRGRAMEPRTAQGSGEVANTQIWLTVAHAHTQTITFYMPMLFLTTFVQSH